MADTFQGLSRIGQVAVTVKDLTRATAFYRDTLGMSFLFDAPGMSFFRCGEVRLMLARPETPDLDHPASLLYYQVEDLGAAVAALRGRGVSSLRDPHLVARMSDHDLWMADFRDSEDNLLVLMSEVRKSA